MVSASLRLIVSSPRHALTLIETVAAVTILSILAAVVLGASGNMMSAQIRQQHRLGAMELANRLMLQQLDDPNSMPEPSLPIAYGKDRYRWTLARTPAKLIPARTDIAAERAGRSAIVVDRMEVITIRVWLSEESGGSYQLNNTIPSAALARLADPIADAYRNPDSTEYLIKSDPARLMNRLRSVESGGLLQRSNRPRDDQPGSRQRNK